MTNKKEQTNNKLSSEKGKFNEYLASTLDHIEWNLFLMKEIFPCQIECT